ncbi:IS4 family transposase [Streptomyces sp. NBC_00233]|uniref:IS4 family transposase n=1 Tax=Streptomyces sp. NBC_00233 TaxID=2975686 RepID=UPI00225228C4|nr:IS4 family transposase [Streptomyces sp. NBC_00233]MCX5233449.1 IS4 family transposase [Streptomyces sp. NBC_00233]
MLRQVVTRRMVTDALAASGCGDRRSDGKLSALTCVFFVLALTLFPRDGYRSVLSKLAGGTVRLAARGQLVSSSALRQRRLALGPEPFRLLFERIAGPAGMATMPGVFWRGLRLVSVDGTYLEVADTAVNAVFGRTRNQRRIAAFPQVHLVALIECGTRALLGAAFDVRRVCEQDLTRRLLDRMRPGMLVLADRGFPGWLLWVDAAARGTHLLWRISAAVLLVPDEILPDGSWLATRHAHKNIWKALAGRPRSVRIRVIEMVVVIEAADGSRRREPYRLITTLLDHVAYPAGELAALYSQRWESGLQFRDLKITQRGPRAVLRSKTPVLVNQEIWAYRRHDVFLARPRGWRNQVWETDHVQAPVLVDVEGTVRRPWITWFVDCASNTIMGVAVTPGHPSRESVLAALRAAVVREEPFGPQGGLPEKVRVDRGKDFLSKTVAAAFNALDVTVEDLPAYTPHLKGTVEGLNRAVESMFLASLPGYVRQPRPGQRPARPRDEVLLDFEDFTARLLDWVSWWNTVHQPDPLGGKTPLEAWETDPTPLREVSAEELWTFTLEETGRFRVISTRGVRFRSRDYVGAWMTGQSGLRVRVRFMPHHQHRIEVFDAATGRYLGPAELADAATPEQISAVRTERATRTPPAAAGPCRSAA